MEEEKHIKHYSSSHKILLVGEGDFSFSVCLARAFQSAINMVATSLDSHDAVVATYSNGKANLEVLRELGCNILHEVNVHTMAQHPHLNTMKFDRIVFNFPHAGFQYREHQQCQIELHQEVVRGFFRSARKMLTENGQVHVTHKTAYPFSAWNVESLGQEVGLRWFESAPFFELDYPGYNNKRGEGSQCDLSFPVGSCSTYKFFKRY